MDDRFNTQATTLKLLLISATPSTIVLELVLFCHGAGRQCVWVVPVPVLHSAPKQSASSGIWKSLACRPVAGPSNNLSGRATPCINFVALLYGSAAITGIATMEQCLLIFLAFVACRWCDAASVR